MIRKRRPDRYDYIIIIIMVYVLYPIGWNLAHFTSKHKTFAKKFRRNKTFETSFFFFVSLCVYGQLTEHQVGGHYYPQ